MDAREAAVIVNSGNIDPKEFTTLYDALKNHPEFAKEFEKLCKTRLAQLAKGGDSKAIEVKQSGYNGQREDVITVTQQPKEERVAEISRGNEKSPVSAPAVAEEQLVVRQKKNVEAWKVQYRKDIMQLAAKTKKVETPVIEAVQDGGLLADLKNGTTLNFASANNVSVATEEEPKAQDFDILVALAKKNNKKIKLGEEMSDEFRRALIEACAKENVEISNMSLEDLDLYMDNLPRPEQTLQSVEKKQEVKEEQAPVHTVADIQPAQTEETAPVAEPVQPAVEVETVVVPAAEEKEPEAEVQVVDDKQPVDEVATVAEEKEPETVDTPVVDDVEEKVRAEVESRTAEIKSEAESKVAEANAKEAAALAAVAAAEEKAAAAEQALKQAQAEAETKVAEAKAAQAEADQVKVKAEKEESAQAVAEAEKRAEEAEARAKAAEQEVEAAEQKVKEAQTAQKAAEEEVEALKNATQEEPAAEEKPAEGVVEDKPAEQNEQADVVVAPLFNPVAEDENKPAEEKVVEEPVVEDNKPAEEAPVVVEIHDPVVEEENKDTQNGGDRLFTGTDYDEDDFAADEDDDSGAEYKVQDEEQPKKKGFFARMWDKVKNNKIVRRVVLGAAVVGAIVLGTRGCNSEKAAPVKDNVKDKTELRTTPVDTTAHEKADTTTLELTVDPAALAPEEWNDSLTISKRQFDNMYDITHKHDAEGNLWRTMWLNAHNLGKELGMSAESTMYKTLRLAAWTNKLNGKECDTHGTKWAYNYSGAFGEVVGPLMANLKCGTEMDAETLAKAETMLSAVGEDGRLNVVTLDQVVPGTSSFNEHDGQGWIIGKNHNVMTGIDADCGRESEVEFRMGQAPKAPAPVVEETPVVKETPVVEETPVDTISIPTIQPVKLEVPVITPPDTLKAPKIEVKAPVVSSVGSQMNDQKPGYRAGPAHQAGDHMDQVRGKSDIQQGTKAQRKNALDLAKDALKSGAMTQEEYDAIEKQITGTDTYQLTQERYTYYKNKDEGR